MSSTVVVGQPYSYSVCVSTIGPFYRYIVRTPGGHARIEGTRVGLHDVIGLLQNGETIDTVITNCFSDLTRAQGYECLAYCEDHRGEIDVDHDGPDELSYRRRRRFDGSVPLSVHSARFGARDVVGNAEVPATIGV